MIVISRAWNRREAARRPRADMEQYELRDRQMRTGVDSRGRKSDSRGQKEVRHTTLVLLQELLRTRQANARARVARTSAAHS